MIVLLPRVSKPYLHVVERQQCARRMELSIRAQADQRIRR